MKTSDERKQQLDREDFACGNQYALLGAFTHVALPSYPSDSPRLVCHTLLLVLIFIFTSSIAQSLPSQGLGDHRRTSFPSLIGSTSTTSNMVSGEARPVAGYRGSHMERECVCYVSFVPVPGALMLCVVCLSLPFQTSQDALSLLSLHLVVRAPTPRPEDAVQTSIEHLQRVGRRSLPWSFWQGQWAPAMITMGLRILDHSTFVRARSPAAPFTSSHPLLPSHYMHLHIVLDFDR